MFLLLLLLFARRRRQLLLLPEPSCNHLGVIFTEHLSWFLTFCASFAIYVFEILVSGGLKREGTWRIGGFDLARCSVMGYVDSYVADMWWRYELNGATRFWQASCYNLPKVFPSRREPWRDCRNPSTRQRISITLAEDPNLVPGHNSLTGNPVIYEYQESYGMACCPFLIPN